MPLKCNENNEIVYAHLHTANACFHQKSLPFQSKTGIHVMFVPNCDASIIKFQITTYSHSY